jgi:ATP-dependent Lhr-like helicase
MVVRGRLECTGPHTEEELARALDLAVDAIAVACARLEGDGLILRGQFSAPSQSPASGGRQGPPPAGYRSQWCDRRLLARIHQLTLGRLRREIEPVPAADLMRFLFRWQHVQSGTQLHGRPGVLEVIGQLEGIELPARAWEAQVLPARIANYDPDELDHLCLAGAVAWGRLRTDPPEDAPADPRRPRVPNRAAPLAFVLREDLPWLLAPAHEAADLTGDARQVLAHLERRGASFAGDIARACGLLPAAV